MNAPPSVIPSPPRDPLGGEGRACPPKPSAYAKASACAKASADRSADMWRRRVRGKRAPFESHWFPVTTIPGHSRVYGCLMTDDRLIQPTPAGGNAHLPPLIEAFSLNPAE
jgi:hypothetical protein